MSGLDIDTRSDIYSLGVLLYELLAGSTPFDGKELMSLGIDAMRKVIREKEPVRPSTKLSQTLVAADVRRLKSPATDTPSSEEEVRASSRRLLRIKESITLLRGDLDWIVMKCLEKDRSRRYETANGLAADLKRHLNNEPVIARPPSAAYKFQKAFRRNKLVFAAGAAVAVALLIGMGVSTWAAFVARKAQRETELARNGEQLQRLEAQSALKTAEVERQHAEANAEKARVTAIKSRRSQYAANMFSAATEIDRGSYVNARNFLAEYFPQDGLEELRGFEWRYWWQLSAGQQLKTFPIGRCLNDLAWSPDGRLMADGESDGSVKLLHADTGEVASIFTNGSSWNVSVAFSFDGHGLAVAGNAGKIHFWNVPDGRLIFTLTNKQPRVVCSPSGPLMAIGTEDDWWGQTGGEVHLVDTTSGQEVRVLPKAGARAAFSPDGKRIATANGRSSDSGSQVVILWDVDSGKKLQVLENIRQVLGLAFSPDGKVLAMATRYGEVILWNLTDFSHTILREATGDFARAVAFSRDGRRLTVGLLTHEVEIWDVPERRQVARLRGHTSEIAAVAYSPDGTQLASGSQDGTIRFWEPQPPTVQILIPEFGLSLLGPPSFSPDGRWLVVAIANGDVQIVDPTTAAWNVRTVLANAGLPVAFSGDAATLLTLTSDLKSLRRWNVASGALLSTTALNCTNTSSRRLAITPDGSRLALANPKLIEVFETRTGRCLGRFPGPVLPECLEFSQDGKRLAISGDNTGALWDIAAGRVVQTFAGHKSRVTSARFSPDQKMIATASWDATVRLWEVATGKELAVLTGHKAGVLNGVFSPDGRTLVTGSDDRTIKFWNLATFREVASIPLTYTPYFLALSPDGQSLIANASDGGLRCWRAPSLAEIDAAEIKGKMEVGK